MVTFFQKEAVMEKEQKEKQRAEVIQELVNEQEKQEHPKDA